jgi:hypothetical protein
MMFAILLSPTVAALTLTVLAMATTLTLAKVNRSRWDRSVAEFREKYHGYTTSSKKGLPTTTNDKKVLLLVCPVSGNGRAMSEFEPTLVGLEAQGRLVEVYITESTEDLMTFAECKNLEPYATIAILSGDSSVFEFVQPVLRQTNGKWPFAPILHLPGGTGNALPSEFYGLEMDVPDIIKHAKKVQKIAVIKACNKEGTVRYALHNCFDGLQVALIDWLDDHRVVSSVLGPVWGLPANVLLFLMTFPFRRNVNLVVLNIVNSDFDGRGINLGFGVTRFDGKMAVIAGTRPYASKYQVLQAYFHFLSSKLAVNVKDGSTALPYNLSCQICDRATTVRGHYKLYFDGSSSLPLEGDEITFEVIPEAVPFVTVPM